MADERGRRIFRADLYNKRHIRNLIAQSRAIQSLFDDLSREAARIGEATKFNDPSEPFYWRDHPAAQKQVDELLASVAQQMQLTIEEGNKQEWLLANAKNDEMVKTILSSSNIPKARLAQFTARNLDALEAFQSRKVGGMNLSDRVWALRDNLKGELELALDIGLGEGCSADRLSRDVRQYLKEPNKLFRRVKDKHGVLRLSQSAAAYHPGRGVYRSSYKNALRMTATENNMAYRTADHERWQQIDFVIGIEIQLSNNHPVVDICDELKGVYPKDFKFTGWHPFCRCHAVAKLPSQEEFVKYQQAMIDGEDVSDWKFKGEVTEMPKQWNDWLEENAERISSAQSLPYFLSDNAGLIGLSESQKAIESLIFSDNNRRTINNVSKIYDELIEGNWKYSMPLDEYASGSAEINDVARFGKLMTESYNSNYVEDWEESIKMLDKVLDELPRLPQDIDLFRYSNTLGGLRIKGMSLKEINSLAGETFVDKGFTSFSFSRKFVEGNIDAEDYVIVLKAQKGLKGASIANTSAFNTLERQEEFLVARNTGYKIMGAKEVKGKKYLFVEVDNESAHKYGDLGAHKMSSRAAGKAASALYSVPENNVQPVMSVELKANRNKLAEAVGIPKSNIKENMTHYDANSGLANVDLHKSGGDENCALSVLSYEARRRGVNVTALPYSSDEKSWRFKIGTDEYSHGAWQNAGQGSRVKIINGMVDPKSLEQQTKAVGRYHLSWDYVERGIDGEKYGHMLVAERLKSGELVIYCPQKNAYWSVGEFMGIEKGSFVVRRVDNKLFNVEVLSQLVRPL